jgi:AcrR family transcriptional regulator
MSLQARRERERAEREKLIVAAARELVESEGWDAVTTRRLAELVEYSQPVLYSHFTGKDAIMVAVAMEGFTDLAEELRDAALSGLAAVATAYTSFAERRPALYDGMFSRAVDLPFASPEAPAALHAAFDALSDALRPHAGDDDLGLLTETFWAALHGLATLTRGGRLPHHAHDERLTILLSRFTS